MYGRIDQKSLAETDEFQMTRNLLPPETAMGELIKITGVDGASKEFQIVGMSATRFLLRASPPRQSQEVGEK